MPVVQRVKDILPSSPPARAQSQAPDPVATQELGRDTATFRTATDREKRNFRLVVDLVSNELLVVDKKKNQPVDAYTISPGSQDHPTQGDHFVIRRVIEMPSWNPPKSEWAEGMSPQKPGIFNPMGVVKMDLGRFTQFIHGTPLWRLPELGRATSHGCIRLSNSNVAHLYRHYVTKGTVVDVVRNPAASQKMHAQMAGSGVAVRGIMVGSELADAIVAAHRQ